MIQEAKVINLSLLVSNDAEECTLKLCAIDEGTKKNKINSLVFIFCKSLKKFMILLMEFPHVE